jgi:hypothetical protein
VLKCIGKDAGRGFADVFWHPDTTGGAHHFVPRGLAADRRYHVHPR